MPLIALLAVLWFAVIAWATRDGRDAAHDGRSIDRYHHAMRVLSRRPAAPRGGNGARYILVPTAAVTDDGARPRPVTATARRKAMLRRLAWASALTLAALAFLGGPVWLVAHLATDALLAGYVVLLRRDALRTAERTRVARRAALEQRASEHRAAYDAAHQHATVTVMPVRADEPRRAVND